MRMFRMGISISIKFILQLKERYDEFAKNTEQAQQKVEQAKSANRAQGEIAKLTGAAQV